MALPQGMTLQRGFGDHTVWVVGPGGRYALKNPQEAAKLVGPGWINEIQDVLPGSFENVPQFTSMDQALRAPPVQTMGAPGSQYGGKNIGIAPAPNFTGTDYGMGQSYNNAAQYNQQLYGNILGGYQQVLRDQQQAQQKVQQGYGDLRNSVMGQLQGVEAAQKQQIADDYARAQGQAQQTMASRGLGNTTIAGGVGRGLLADKTRAETALAGQMGQMRAGYESDLGLAGLGFGGAAIQANTGLAGAQFDWMAGTKMDLPDPAQYAGFALQAKQMDLERQRLNAQYAPTSTSVKNFDGSYTNTYNPGYRFS